MQVLSALIMVYILLITIRVILSWIPSGSAGTQKLNQLLHKITDPYMNKFRGIGWLRAGMMDFSPVLGLVILSFALYITQRLSSGSFPSIGELLIWIINMAWGIVAFLVTILAIAMIVRLITLYTIKGSRPNWIDKLDAFLFPKVSRILGVFTQKTVSYPLALAVCAVSLGLSCMSSFLDRLAPGTISLSGSHQDIDLCS